jgi:Protein of unknown function (DUF4230)
VPTTLEDAPRRAPERAPEVTVRVVTEETRRTRRRLPSIASMVTTLEAAAAVVAVFLVVGVVTGILHFNPFATTTIDRSPPAVLKQLNNLTRYTAAQGKYESTIDVEDDVSILPSFIAGEHTIFIARGTVDANVDFAALSGDAVQVRGDHAVTITLGEPTFGKPVVDPDTSRVASQDRGLVNRIGDFFSSDANGAQRFYQMADTKLAAAARASKLLSRAEKNTTTMLQGLLGRVGYTDVQVRFTNSTPATAPRN